MVINSELNALAGFRTSYSLGSHNPEESCKSSDFSAFKIIIFIINDNNLIRIVCGLLYALYM